MTDIEALIVLNSVDTVPVRKIKCTPKGAFLSKTWQICRNLYCTIHWPYTILVWPASWLSMKNLMVRVKPFVLGLSVKLPTFTKKVQNQVQSVLYIFATCLFVSISSAKSNIHEAVIAPDLLTLLVKDSVRPKFQNVGCWSLFCCNDHW